MNPLPFLCAWITAPRLTDLHPCDQPVTYASAMLRLCREHGGDAWVRRFFQHLTTAPDVEARDEAGALAQARQRTASSIGQLRRSRYSCSIMKTPLIPLCLLLASLSGLRAEDPKPAPAPSKETAAVTQTNKVVKTEAEWRKQMTEMQYYVTRQKGTERAYTGKYWNHKGKGVYTCSGCGVDLFVSDAKFDSGCGWPSFFQPLNTKMVDEHRDTTHGMIRTEVTCARCDAHLGHVFNDGPKPTGLRYCINSASIEFRADSAVETKKAE